MPFIINSDTGSQSPGSVVYEDLEIGPEDQVVATDGEGGQGDQGGQGGHQGGQSLQDD